MLEGLVIRQACGIYAAATRRRPSMASRRPRLDFPRLRVACFSFAALSEGIEHHRAAGVTLRVTSPARTVADCFKYRKKIGVDVAVEALRGFSRKHRVRAGEPARFARICRVSRVM